MNFTRQLEQRGSTILFVSHNMFSIKSMCERVIYLKQGKVVYDGPTDEGLKRYEADSKLQTAPWFDQAPKQPALVITDVKICADSGEEVGVVDFGASMRVRIAYKALRRIERPDFRVGVNRADDIHCSSFSTAADHVDIPFVEGEGEVELRTPPTSLVSDLYNVTVVVRERGDGQILVAQIGGAFHVRHPVYASNAFGVFHEKGEWRLTAPQKPRVDAAHDRK